MECFRTTDFDNNSQLITLSAIIISGLHCINQYSCFVSDRYHLVKTAKICVERMAVCKGSYSKYPGQGAYGLKKMYL